MEEEYADRERRYMAEIQKVRKKLIEVALPLDAINRASAREKSIRHGHPCTLHLWWARRPLAAARAVIFAQMVDDPSSWPELFPSHESQEKERQRLFQLIEELVKWENTNNETLLEQARAEIRSCWRRTCAEQSDHPRAAELFDQQTLPSFHDPFAGGGALPLEAQRLGLEAHASDLNPVAVVINKAMIEIPPKFAGRPPVNPKSRNERTIIAPTWRGPRGLAEDVRYYGRWMREEAQKRIGKLYPPVEITPAIVRKRPDLKRYQGRKMTVIAWLWARTVKSPNPAFADVDVPLILTFMLSTKRGKEVYIDPVVEGGNYRFRVKVGAPPDRDTAKAGTGAGSRQGFRCLLSGAPITYEYIRSEGKAKRMKACLIAIVAKADRGRVYLAPTAEHLEIAQSARPNWRPQIHLEGKARVNVGNYGLTTFGDLFTPRQLVALTTFSDLVQEATDRVRRDAITAGLSDDERPLRDGGVSATAYAEAVGVYLGLSVSRTANTINAHAVWSKSRNQSVNLFSRQAIPMTWDFPEVNPFSGAAGDFGTTTVSLSKTIPDSSDGYGTITQADAKTQCISTYRVISTDPPYYDNVAYADLSDFFYVWQRRILRQIYPELFATMSVPKTEELVATPYRHRSKTAAETYFLNGMSQALRQLSEQAHPAVPVTIYYAFKQTEKKWSTGKISTGWETFLGAVIRSGFAITGTWPMRTERPTGVKVAVNALASSIVLVCRLRTTSAPVTIRREFITTLRTELQRALRLLQTGNIAPVDFAQAAIGPGMAVFTRYTKVLNAAGDPIQVREALALINQILDEVLAEQEGDFDAETRWALAWFEQQGFSAGEFGIAELLSKAKDIGIDGLVSAGIVISRAGNVRLLRPEELTEDWDPDTNSRLSVWEILHRIIQVMAIGGETAAAKLVARLGNQSETARELAYRLYTVCERKKHAAEALAYNSLVKSWPEIVRLARARGRSGTEQNVLFG